MCSVSRESFEAVSMMVVSLMGATEVAESGFVRVAVVAHVGLLGLGPMACSRCCRFIAVPDICN